MEGRGDAMAEGMASPVLRVEGRDAGGRVKGLKLSRVCLCLKGAKRGCHLGTEAPPAPTGAPRTRRGVCGVTVPPGLVSPWTVRGWAAAVVIGVPKRPAET